MCCQIFYHVDLENFCTLYHPLVIIITTLYMFWMDIALLKPTWIYMAFMIFFISFIIYLEFWISTVFALWAISYFLLKYTFLFFAQIHRRTFNSVCLNFEFHLFWIPFEISSQSLSWTLFVQICICLLSLWHFFKPGEYLKSKDQKRNFTCRPQISGATKLKVYLSDGAFLLVKLSCK